MNIIKSHLFKNTLIYTFASSISAISGFLLLPILTRHLSPSDYGILEIIRTAIALLIGVILFGGNTIVTGEYYKIKKESRNVIINISLSVIILLSVILSLAVFMVKPLSEYIEKILDIEGIWIITAICIAGAQAIITLITSILQIKEKPTHYVFITTGALILNITTSLYMVIVQGLGWKGVILGMAISTFTFSFLCILLLYSNKQSRVNMTVYKRYSKLIIRLAPALVFAHIAGWMNEGVGKIMIGTIIDVKALGIYAVGYKFGMVVLMIESAYSRAWLPFFYKNINGNTPENDKKIVKATYYSILALFIFAILVSLVGPLFLKYMVDDRYIGASKFIALLCMAYYFDGVWKLFTGYLVHNRKTNYYSYIVAVSAIVNILLSYYLITKIGVIGAAWASLSSFFVGAILTIVVASIVHPMPWFLLAKNKNN